MSATPYHYRCDNPWCGYCAEAAATDPARYIREALRRTRPQPQPRKTDHGAEDSAKGAER